MLTQVNHWMEYAGAGVDLLLLMRVLSLRLHRTYLFITLACLLQVFFDGVSLWLGPETQASLRVFVYSRFLFAFVFPVAAWDVFEELKSQLANLRRTAISRTVTSLLMITIFGLVMAGFAESADDANGLAFLSTLAVVVWTGSATGSLAFLWVMHRGLRMQKLEPPNNTFVWMIFFELFLAEQIVECFYFLIPPVLNATVLECFRLALMLYVMGITVWCTVKLKTLPSDVPSASMNPSS